MVFVGHSLTPSRHAEFISASHGIPKQVRNDRKALLLYLASILSAIFAMKTKENAFTLPLVIALYEFLFFKGSLGKRILYLIPLLLTMLIIPLTLIGIDKPVGEIISGVEPATRGYGEISRGDYLLTQFRVIVTYIRLLFLPINQNIGYDYQIFHSFFKREVFLSFVFLFFIFISSVYLLYLSRTKNTALRLIAFGIFWFFVTLSVESSIIPIPMWINEYRVYLPSIGVFTAIVTGAFLFTERLKNKKTQKVILSFLALMPLVLSPATYKRNTVWGSEISLWEDVARKSPNKARVYNNLGAVYEEKGLIDNAIKHYQSAVRLKPDLIEAHYNLGIVYIDKGDLDKARKELEMALQINPNDHQTRELLNSIK